MASVPSYVKKYLRMKPEVTQILDDLEAYKDFIRMQIPQVPFNEADLYKNSSPLWQKFVKQRSRQAYRR
jgi:hypothetical protein